MNTKKTYIYIIVLALVGCFFFSQEIIGKKQKEYLFIGSIKNDSLKVFSNEKIEWIKSNELHRLEKLNATDFLDKLFSKHLQFEMEGYEPFWSARIYKNTLVFVGPETGIEEKYSINYSYGKNKSDSGVKFSFSNKTNKIYGHINYLGIESTKHTRICEYNLSEEDSLYEIFITYRGVTYKGCSVIINKK